MAYRDPETLTCPSCNRSGELVWVIGEGPNTKPGESPAYTDVMEPGAWQIETQATAPKWRGVVTCPDCGKTVPMRK